MFFWLVQPVQVILPVTMNTDKYVHRYSISFSFSNVSGAGPSSEVPS